MPLTDATTGLVDRDFLAAMPDGALLVNVARGRVVDTDALVEAAVDGRLRAALDVTDPEPLPAGPPPLGQPRRPHHPARRRRTSALPPPGSAPGPGAARSAYAQGRPLRNVVHAG